MLDVSFLNKNMYRRYPLRSTSTMTSDQGVEIPLTLVAGLSLSTVLGNHTLYISKIIVNGDYINVTISSYGSPSVTLGYFSAMLTDDFQNVALTSVQNYAAGHIVFGFKNTLSLIQGSNTFPLSESQLEDSVITTVVTPTIQEIKIGDKSITGEINVEFNNISGLVDDDLEYIWTVVDMSAIMSRVDTSATRSNCPINIIGDINGVKPLNGNIDIYGILPVVIDITSQGIQVTTPGVGFKEICANVKDNIPPTISGTESFKSHYLEDVLTADTEEWKTWPQNS